MSIQLIEIASDVLHRAQEPQVRRNAATALGVLGTPAAAATLVSTAVKDAEASVREHAAAEVLRLQPGDGASAVSTLQGLLADPAHGARAYELLGRVRSRSGRAIPLDIPLVEQLRLETRLNRALVPRSWLTLPSGRPVAATVLGTLGAFALLAPMVAWRMNVAVISTALGVWLICSGVAAVLLGAASTLRATPIGLHPSRMAAVLVEAGWVMLLTLAAAVFGAAGLESLELLLLLPLFAAAVRVGSVLGAAGRFRRPSGRQTWATVTGGSAGLLLLAAFTALRGPYDGVVDGVVPVTLVPVAFGLAHAYARGDRGDALPVDSGASMARIAAAVITLGAAVVVAVFLFAHRPPGPEGFANVVWGGENRLDLAGADSAEWAEWEVPLDTLPFRLALMNTMGFKVQVTATDMVDGVDLTLGVFDAHAKPITSPEDSARTTFTPYENDLFVVVDRASSRMIHGLAPAASTNFHYLAGRTVQRFWSEPPYILLVPVATADTGPTGAGLTVDTVVQAAGATRSTGVQTPVAPAPARRVLHVSWKRMW
jgi:HEAT repeats